MFPLAPLLFVALVLWLARGLERPPLVAAIAAIVPVLLLLPDHGSRSCSASRSSRTRSG